MAPQHQELAGLDIPDAATLFRRAEEDTRIVR